MVLASQANHQLPVKAMWRVLSLLVLLGSTAILFILALDTFGVLSTPEDYRIAQQFPEAELSWRTPSVMRYALQNLGLLMLFAALAFLSLQYSRGHLRPLWVKVYAVAVAVLFCVIAGGYLYWWQTGFDH